MKRKVAVILLLLLCCMTCMSCSRAEKKNSQEEKVEITIWHYYSGSQKAAFDHMVENYNETEGMDKGITVNAVAMDSINNLTSQLKMAADKKVGSKELPDLFSAYVDMAETMDEKGLLVNLDDYFSKDELSGYVDAYIEEGRFDSEKNLKLFPIAKATEVMMVNKTKWDEFAFACNVDVSMLSTWEGLAQAAQIYYEWSGGKAMFGRDVIENYLLAGGMELGMEIFEVKDAKATLNMEKEVMRKLWDNYYTPYINGFYSKEGRYASDDLKIGDIIAYVGSTSSAAYFPDEVYYDTEDTGSKIECMVLPVPDFADGKSFVIQQGAGMAMIHSDEKKEKACADFLKWITDSERNASFAVEASYLPVTKEANHAEYIEKVAKEHSLDVSEKVLKTLEVSIEKMNESTTYTLPSFTNSYDARATLGDAFQTVFIQDRAGVVESMEQGMSREEAAAPYLTEDRFDQWYESVVEQVREAMGLDE